MCLKTWFFTFFAEHKKGDRLSFVDYTTFFKYFFKDKIMFKLLKLV